MGFWSGEKLKNRPEVISGFNERNVDCNSYSLHMGEYYYRTADTEGEKQKKVALSEGESFLIPEGQFGFLLTKEEVHIPRDAMAFISMRTSVKFRGLINVSGFHVDPGYSGKLIFAVFNAGSGPIHLCEGDKIFKIWFCDLDRQSSLSNVFSGPGLRNIGNDLIDSMSREILSLQSLAKKVEDYEKRMDEQFSQLKPIIENLAFVWRALVTGVVTALAVAGILYTFSVLYL